MLCPKCRREIEEDAKFCGYCGYEFVEEKDNATITTTLCPNCGAELEENNTFCPNCRARMGTVEIEQIFDSPEERESYEKWKEKGRFSRKKADILAFIGIFIFGWLLWIVYAETGKRGWHIFVPIIALYGLSRAINPIFALFGVAIYVWAWINIRNTIKKFEKIFEQES